MNQPAFKSLPIKFRWWMLVSLRTLASLRFSVVLLIVLVAVLIWATLLEAAPGASTPSGTSMTVAGSDATGTVGSEYLRGHVVPAAVEEEEVGNDNRLACSSLAPVCSCCWSAQFRRILRVFKENWFYAKGKMPASLC